MWSNQVRKNKSKWERCIGSIQNITDGALDYFPALHLWVDPASPADFAREPSTVISSKLHSGVGTAPCWSSPPTTASRWVPELSPRCGFGERAPLSGRCDSWCCRWCGALQVKAVVYQTVKDLVRQQFLSNHAGPWNPKRLVDCFSAWMCSWWLWSSAALCTSLTSFRCIPLLCMSNTVVFSLCRCLRKTRDPTVVHQWSSQFE